MGIDCYDSSRHVLDPPRNQLSPPTLGHCSNRSVEVVDLRLDKNRRLPLCSPARTARGCVEAVGNSGVGCVETLGEGRVQVIRPPRHKQGALPHEFGVVIGGGDLILLHVRQLHLDVGRIEVVLVQNS